MTITFWTTEGRAFINAEGISKEFKQSIRFDLGNGKTTTIKRNDIISIEEDEIMKGISIESIKTRIEESYNTRSAWSKGVLQYATEILDEIDGHNGDGLFYTEAIMKNGYIATLLTSGYAFDAWKQYSRSGSSLIFDEDIAKRLCSPSELKRTENGMKNPNRREDWLDVQGRALFQAAELIKRAVRELLPA